MKEKTNLIMESLNLYTRTWEDQPIPDEKDEKKDEKDEKKDEKDGAVVENPASKKICANCRSEEHLEAFPSHPLTKDGRQTWCRKCLGLTKKKRKPDEENQDKQPDDASDDISELVDSLYVFTNPLVPNMLKIGRSFDPNKRAKKLATSHPYELVINYTYQRWGFLEKMVHNKLKEWRVNGGTGQEWFYIEPKQADILIKATAIEHELRSRSQ